MSDQSSPPSSQQESAPGRYVVIARRYRPQTFEDLVGQEHAAHALQQAIATGRVGHAYLFTGARGVGKTSAARILAKALNCVHGPTPTPCNACDVCLRVATGDDVDVLEIDGASNRGIDEIRQLRQNVAVRPSRVRYKIYIIDEVHMLTKEAFNALLKTLEEPPEHVKFIFATTEAHKIPITILSRCQRFDFAGISAEAIQTRLAQIAATEGVSVDAEALQILASRAAGSMRDSQSLLEQLLAAGHDRITKSDVNSLLGIAPAERLSGLVQHLVARNASAALAELDATIESGVEIGLLLDQLVGYFRDVMASAAGCKANQFLYALPSQAEEVAGVGSQLGLATILAIGQILDHTAARMRLTMHGRTLVEMAVVRICQLGELDELATLIAELRGSSSSSGDNAAAPAAAKKNDERRPLAEAAAAASMVLRRTDSPHEKPSGVLDQSAPVERTKPALAPISVPSSLQNASPPVSQPAASAAATQSAVTSGDSEHISAMLADEPAPAAADSVLAQWQRAIAEKGQARPTAPPRPSRREQLAAISEQPFVRRAMELFDVAPDRIRYTPPEDKSTTTT
jgi:DNA polymerase III subunit gamma/tau